MFDGITSTEGGGLLKNNIFVSRVHLHTLKLLQIPKHLPLHQWLFESLHHHETLHLLRIPTKSQTGPSQQVQLKGGGLDLGNSLILKHPARKFGLLFRKPLQPSVAMDQP